LRQHRASGAKLHKRSAEASGLERPVPRRGSIIAQARQKKAKRTQGAALARQRRWLL
jgi:hypothetical protein